jgi:hypothetical protein
MESLPFGYVELTMHSVESLDSKTFQYFLDILEETRGEFIREASARLTSNLIPILEGENSITVLQLENEDLKTLTKEQVNPPTLLRLCQPA